MRNLIKRILKEDFEYWKVSDASPNSDEYEMGIVEEEGEKKSDEKQVLMNKMVPFIVNTLIRETDFGDILIKTPIGEKLSTRDFTYTYFNKRPFTIPRTFIIKFYNYMFDTYSFTHDHYQIIEKTMSEYFKKIRDIVNDDKKKNINEDVPIYKEHNLGKKMYNRLRKTYPMTPEYVLKDYFFNNIVGNYDYIKKEHYGDPLLVTRGYWDEYLKGPWKLEILNVNPEDFDDRTVNAFVERDFGNIDAYQVPDDEERTQTQRRLSKPTGMNEPVIVELKPNGKYELVEGWHRTMSILLLGDNGEDLKNWDKVKIRAFVRDLSK